MHQDEEYMEMAIGLAKKGSGRVNPNPMVGAVIVKDGRVIGSGYHEQYGGPHAERNALTDCRSAPAGATLYVTLEPCCHYGKTPPCTEAVLESKISRVVVGATDPNPLMAGKGIEQLRKQGVTVDTGVLEEKCLALNKVFFHYIKTGRPFVLMKFAMSLDGKIATRTGESKWITGEEARVHVHQSRKDMTGIMVGVNTVLADDPHLTCRIPDGRNPIRVICDSHLKTPVNSNLVKTAGEIPTYIAVVSAGQEEKRRMEDAGVNVLVMPPGPSGRVDLGALMKELGALKIDSILLEGGSELNYSALESGIVTCVHAYIAPSILGGVMAKTPVGGEGVALPGQGFQLKRTGITAIGEDCLLVFDVLSNEVMTCSRES